MGQVGVLRTVELPHRRAHTCAYTAHNNDANATTNTTRYDGGSVTVAACWIWWRGGRHNHAATAVAAQICLSKAARCGTGANVLSYTATNASTTDPESYTV